MGKRKAVPIATIRELVMFYGAVLDGGLVDVECPRCDTIGQIGIRTPPPRWSAPRVDLGPFHIDHVVPVAAGGTNDFENLQLLCGPCNLRKAASVDGS